MLYDFGILTSKKAEVFTVVIGNLSFGGTGKTPVAIKVISLLSKLSKVGFVSRGYGRKTKGVLKITANSNANDVGDEPLQVYSNCKNLTSAVVGEDRHRAIKLCLGSSVEPPGIVVLDDAFQHRKLHPGFSILLFDYNSLSENLLFPVGKNRDLNERTFAADVIIITKIPDAIDATKLKSAFRKYGKPVLFGKLKYQLPENPVTSYKLKSYNHFQWLFFSGIAKPHYAIDFLKQQKASFEHVTFNDHHIYSEREIKMLADRAIEKKLKLLCTEKDWIKVKERVLHNELWKEIFYVLKVEMYFSPADEQTLTNLIYAKYRNSN